MSPNTVTLTRASKEPPMPSAIKKPFRTSATPKFVLLSASQKSLVPSATPKPVILSEGVRTANSAVEGPRKRQSRRNHRSLSATISPMPSQEATQ